MQPEDMHKIIRWMGYVYAPIVLLIIGVYILVQYREHQIAKVNPDYTSPVISTSSITVSSTDTTERL